MYFTKNRIAMPATFIGLGPNKDKMGFISSYYMS